MDAGTAVVCGVREMKKTALVLAMLVLSAVLSAAERSGAQRAEFMRHNPCPANGNSRGTCPGHVVDHITPLCAGGEDRPHNMQWQTIDEGKRKDKEEHRQCRELRKARRGEG